MPTLTKHWSDGATLSVTYTGVGDGVATIVADSNPGEDRDATLVFSTTDGKVKRPLYVSQPGLRERFSVTDGHLLSSDGSPFLVLKS